MRKALAIWLDAGSRINAAHVRLRLAEMLAASGDTDEAVLEATSAQKAFADMQAHALVARCEQLLRAAKAPTAARAGAAPSRRTASPGCLSRRS